MKLVSLVLGLVCFASPVVTLADPAPKRDTAAILFENPDWTAAPAGTKINYSYARNTYGSTEYGPSFEDTIAMMVMAGDKPADRKVEVRMFSGARQMPAGPFESISTNPVFLIVFENHVQTMSRLLQANPRYLKNAIRKAWRDNATIEDAPVNVGDKTVAGTRVTIRPFIDDPMKDRMKGLEGLTYVVEVAHSVPGEIVAIDIHAPPDGAPRYSETLRYQPEKTP